MGLLLLAVALAASRVGRVVVGADARVARVRGEHREAKAQAQEQRLAREERREEPTVRAEEAAVPPPAKEEEMIWGMPKQTLAGVMGPLGCSLAIVMFLSAAPVAYEIYKLDGVGEFSCFPYTMQVGNCSLWLVYALADPTPARREAMFIPLLCNAIGLVITGAMWSWFIYFADGPSRRGVFMYALPTFVSILAFAAYVFTTGVEHDAAGKLSGPRQTAAYIAGLSCMVINIAMYMGPLAGIKNAFAAKTTKYMPLSLGVTTFVNSTPWFLFGLGIGDMPVWLPNACGIVFGLVQIAVYCYLQRAHGKGLEAEDLHVEQAKEPLLQRVSTVGNIFDLGRVATLGDGEPLDKRRTAST